MLFASFVLTTRKVIKGKHVCRILQGKLVGVVEALLPTPSFLVTVADMKPKSHWQTATHCEQMVPLCCFLW